MVLMSAIRETKKQRKRRVARIGNRGKKHSPQTDTSNKKNQCPLKARGGNQGYIGEGSRA